MQVCALAHHLSQLYFPDAVGIALQCCRQLFLHPGSKVTFITPPPSRIQDRIIFHRWNPASDAVHVPARGRLRRYVAASTYIRRRRYIGMSECDEEGVGPLAVGRGNSRRRLLLRGSWRLLAWCLSRGHVVAAGTGNRGGPVRQQHQHQPKYSSSHNSNVLRDLGGALHPSAVQRYEENCIFFFVLSFFNGGGGFVKFCVRLHRKSRFRPHY